MFVGLVLGLFVLVCRSATANRHVRGRLLASALAFGGYAAIEAARRYGSMADGLQQQFDLIGPLLLAFGAVNAVVALAINPWRADRLPDRFPTIVQDTIVIALFAAAATLILQDRIFATTAVGAVVIGLALQDTLGNLFAGLAIQIEKPFRVGQWVNVAGKDGMVTEITWRATKIRTKPGNFLIVPNSALSKDTITNYSEPTDETRIEVEVGASYDAPPNEVKRVVLDAIRDEPLLLKTRPPEVLLVDFSASAMTYRVRAWTRDFAADDAIRDRMRSAIYYAFRRSDIAIPFPTQVELSKDDLRPAPPEAEAIASTLSAAQIFAALSDEERAQLARVAKERLYAAKEIIVREGDAGNSMFVVKRGEVVVSIASGQEVARLGPGMVFGEMSLLTGAPRSATVAAAHDTDLVELTADAFRRFVLENPRAVELIGDAVSTRAAELEQHRAAGQTPAPTGEPFSLAARIRRFLRLSST